MKLRSVLIVAVCALLAACQSGPRQVIAPAASVVSVPDPVPEKWTRSELFFDFAPYDAEGLGLAAAESTWRAFLDEEVPPRFNEGFTVMEAYGQRSEGQHAQGGEIVRTRYRVLVILHPDNPATRANIVAVREAYRSRTGTKQVPVVEVPISATRL